MSSSVTCSSSSKLEKCGFFDVGHCFYCVNSNLNYILKNGTKNIRLSSMGKGWGVSFV